MAPGQSEDRTKARRLIAFTLDTNCLIDVDEARPTASAVLAVLQASREGRAIVAMAASSASERQQNCDFLQSINVFRDRMSRLGFGDVELLPGILRCGIGFLDNGLLADDEMCAREVQIFSTLFPTHAVEWAAYAAQKGVDPEARDAPHYLKWRNKILDAQAYWAHEHHNRNVFVTSDNNFRRLNGAAGFPDANVLEPEDAAALV